MLKNIVVSISETQHLCDGSHENRTHWLGAVRHCSRKSMQLLQPTRESMRNMKFCLTSKNVWVGYSGAVWKYGKLEVL